MSAPGLLSSKKTAALARLGWQVFHHVVAHGLVGLSLGRLWAWRFHDWTFDRAWPEPAPEVLAREKALRAGRAWYVADKRSRRGTALADRGNLSTLELVRVHLDRDSAEAELRDALRALPEEEAVPRRWPGLE